MQSPSLSYLLNFTNNKGEVTIESDKIYVESPKIKKKDDNKKHLNNLKDYLTSKYM
jgi:hypothetical protein